MSRSAYLLLIFTTGFFLLFNKAYAQPTQQEKSLMKQILPTSPEVGMLGRFGDIPIGYYTGTANISVPLYNIQEYGINIPITIQYHSSGIKVEDQATNVGLGWMLNAGGAITQIIKGVEDDRDDYFTQQFPEDYTFLKANVPVAGVHYTRSQIGSGSLPCTGTHTGDSWFSMQGLLKGYGQPDIYQYSFPGGYSGKFYLNPETKLPVMLDKKEEIAFSKSNGGWLAKAPNGIKFYFETVESVIPNADAYSIMSKTFLLTRIVLTNNKVIRYEYTPEHYTWNLYTETFHSPFPIVANTDILSPKLPGYDDIWIKIRPGATDHSDYCLTKIITEKEEIVFGLTDREDMNQKKVSSITVTDKLSQKPIKIFELDYSYFGYSLIGGNYTYTTGENDYLGKRLKLNSIREVKFDGNGNKILNAPHKFFYNESDVLPLKTSYARDFWGYYNGNNNDRMIPDVTYFYYAGLLRPTTPFSILDNVNNLYKNDRTPNKSVMGLNMLNKIIYPTGGYTQFQYEPNQFTNYNYPDEDKMSVYKKVVHLQDVNSNIYTTIKSFTLPRAMTIKFKHFFSKGNPNNTVTYTDMENALITLTKVTGSTRTVLREWRIGNDYISDPTSPSTPRQDFDTKNGVTINAQWDFPFESNASYELKVDLPDVLGNQNYANKSALVSSDFTYYDIPTIPETASYGGGLRIASIKNYDSDDRLLTHKEIKYLNEDGKSSGILMAPLRYIYERQMHFEYLSRRDPSSPIPSPTDSVKTKTRGDGLVWWLSSESISPLSYSASGAVVGYSRVEEIELADNLNKGKHVYNYNNEESKSSDFVPEDPNLLNGTLKSESVFDVSGHKLKETSYDYASSVGTTYNGFLSQYNIVVNFDCGAFGLYVISAGPNTWMIASYPLNSRWYQLKSKVLTSYNLAGNVVENESFTYNQYGQISSLDKLASNGSKYIKTFKYANDFATSTPYNLMSGDAHMLSNVIEQIDYKDLTSNNPLAKSRQNYVQWPGQTFIVPSSIEITPRYGNVYTAFSYSAYDEYANVTQTNKLSGPPVSYLWGYNKQYPVAEVKNATYQQLVDVLGQTVVDQLNSSPGTDEEVRTKLRLLYTDTRLKNAQVTTFTYAPLIGMTSQTDAKGETIYYIYDDFQRLKYIKDSKSNIIKQMDYHYKNQ